MQSGAAGCYCAAAAATHRGDGKLQVHGARGAGNQRLAGGGKAHGVGASAGHGGAVDGAVDGGQDGRGHAGIVASSSHGSAGGVGAGQQVGVGGGTAPQAIDKVVSGGQGGEGDQAGAGRAGDIDLDAAEALGQGIVEGVGGNQVQLERAYGEAGGMGEGEAEAGQESGHAPKHAVAVDQQPVAAVQGGMGTS